MKLTTSPNGLPVANLPSRKFDLNDKVQTTIVNSIDGKQDILTGLIVGYVYQFENVESESIFFFDYTGWIYFIGFVENYNDKTFYFSEVFQEYEISKLE